MRWKLGLLIASVIFIMVCVVGVAFYYTGGEGLVNLYFNYLTQDIADKKYSYQDFRDRGPRETLSGYYAGTIGNNVFVWTLSGLKRFVHQEGTSVYYYMDVCGIVKRLATVRVTDGVQSEELKSSQEPEQMFVLSAWRERVQRGDYVWVRRVGEGAENRIIDKISASSNQQYPLTQVREWQCKD